VTRTEALAKAIAWAESAHRALSRSNGAALNRRAGYPIPAEQPAAELETCRLELEFARTWAAIAAATSEEPTP